MTTIKKDKRRKSDPQNTTKIEQNDPYKTLRRINTCSERGENDISVKIPPYLTVDWLCSSYTKRPNIGLDIRIFLTFSRTVFYSIVKHFIG